jgi:hypothetical protein
MKLEVARRENKTHPACEQPSAPEKSRIDLP